MAGFIEKIKSSGPAAIITSAFIGPGTIIVSTRVGVTFGYELIWAVVFAVIALMILMEMASRIAIVSKKDLVEASCNVFPKNKLWELSVRFLMLIAVVTVCFAFQTGNLTGGSLGLQHILGHETPTAVILLMSFVALIVSLSGSSQILELVMKFFVGAMGLIFIGTMLFVGPSITEIFKGLIPQIPENGYVLTLALIGTTLIGINLILHSITSKDKWSNIEDLETSRWDIVVNILIGGAITFSIMVVSATVLRGTELKGNPALIFTQSLEPVLGTYASIFGNLGLFMAGLSSAIAIPYTLKNITSRVFKFEKGVNDIRAKVIGVVVVIFGGYLAVIGRNPQEIIIVAQATSGLFLPLITVLILVVANNKRIVGSYTNKLWQNAIGVLVVGLTLALGVRGIEQAFEGLLQLVG